MADTPTPDFAEAREKGFLEKFLSRHAKQREQTKERQTWRGTGAAFLSPQRGRDWECMYIKPELLN